MLVLNKHRSAPSQVRMLIDGNEIGIFMPQLDLMDRQIGWELVDAKSMRVAGTFKTADEVSRWLRSAHLALFIALGQVVKA